MVSISLSWFEIKATTIHLKDGTIVNYLSHLVHNGLAMKRILRNEKYDL